ncbi:MAG: hypothetical protein QOJ06_2438 [Pseudonocardiales bacterium]|jgi:hypothetical protein|nr:hypothetical protein [Pseudonocardiales bacterium]
MSIRLVRLYAGDDGQSHFDVGEDEAYQPAGSPSS